MSISRVKSIRLSPSAYFKSRNSSIFKYPIYQSTLKTQSRLTKPTKNLSLEKKSTLESDNCSNILKVSSKKQFQIRNPAIQLNKRSFYQSKLRKNTQDVESRIQDIEILNQITEFNLNVFESIQEIFNDLIRNSDQYQETLSKIKEIYESWIKAAYSKISENKESDFDEINNRLKNEKSKNDELSRKIRTLLKENVKLGKEKEMIGNDFDPSIQSLEVNNKSGFQYFCDKSKTISIYGAKHSPEQ